MRSAQATPTGACVGGSTFRPKPKEMAIWLNFQELGANCSLGGISHQIMRSAQAAPTDSLTRSQFIDDHVFSVPTGTAHPVNAKKHGATTLPNFFRCIRGAITTQSIADLFSKP